MISPYENFLNAARMDLLSAITLAKTRYFSSSLFHLEQSFEKSLKSFYCYYIMSFESVDENKAYKMAKQLDHYNIESVLEVINRFMNKTERYSDAYGIIELKEEVRKARNAMREFQDLKVDKHLFLKQYPDLIKKIYGLCKDRFKESSLWITAGMINKHSEYLMNKYNVSLTGNAEDVKVLSEFITLALALSLGLKDMARMTRYPLQEYAYTNIVRLNSADIESACNSIIEMVYNFVEIVPQMTQLKWH